MSEGFTYNIRITGYYGDVTIESERGLGCDKYESTITEARRAITEDAINIYKALKEIKLSAPALPDKDN